MDRNPVVNVLPERYLLSLSARRAWIEMLMWYQCNTVVKSLSARRAWIEISSALYWFSMAESLSARRAWIEIILTPQTVTKISVALRKESVDRNHAVQVVVVIVYASLSARRAWIEI